jgi:hypothetical protein
MSNKTRVLWGVREIQYQKVHIEFKEKGEKFNSKATKVTLLYTWTYFRKQLLQENKIKFLKLLFFYVCILFILLFIHVMELRIKIFTEIDLRIASYFFMLIFVFLNIRGLILGTLNFNQC